MFNEVLGYKVGADGYFTSEFNEAAGIPKDYKIHSDTLKSLVNVNTNSGILKADFKNIDIAKTVGNAYKILSQVVGEDVLNSKESFNKEDLAKFPQGYEYDNKTLKVLKLHSKISDYMGADSSFQRNERTSITTTFYNSSTIGYYSEHKRLKPSTDILNSNSGGKEDINSGMYFDTTKDKYTDKDGNITKGGLLVGILNKNSHAIEGETTYHGKINGLDKNISSQEYQAKIRAFTDLHGHKYDKYSQSLVDSLPQDLKDFVDFARSLKFVGEINVSDDGKESKSLFEIMQEDMKEAQKRLEKLTRQEKRTQKMLDKNRKYDKELEQNARKNLEELEAMMKFNAKGVDIKA
ncbi:MAG: Cj0814 family flagellar-dependent secreted protein [Campylobacter sp.]